MIDLFKNYKDDLDSFESYLKTQLQNKELADWPAINNLFESINFPILACDKYSVLQFSSNQNEAYLSVKKAGNLKFI